MKIRSVRSVEEIPLGPLPERVKLMMEPVSFLLECRDSDRLSMVLTSLTGFLSPSIFPSDEEFESMKRVAVKFCSIPNPSGDELLIIEIDPHLLYALLRSGLDINGSYLEVLIRGMRKFSLKRYAVVGGGGKRVLSDLQVTREGLGRFMEKVAGIYGESLAPPIRI